LLDASLGIHQITTFRRNELKELVRIHGQIAEGDEQPLSIDEVQVIQGALDFKIKTVSTVMTYVDKVFMLEENVVLDFYTLNIIKEKGHIRIPVFRKRPSNVVGMLLLRDLVVVNPFDRQRVFELKVLPPLFVPTTFSLYDLLNLMQTGASHMAFVYPAVPRPSLLSSNSSNEIEMKEIVEVRRPHGYASPGSSLEPRNVPDESFEMAKHVLVKLHQDSTNLAETSVTSSYVSDPNAYIYFDDKRLQELIDKLQEERMGQDVVGVVTLEDLFEELINEEIYDEKDLRDTGLRRITRRKMKAAFLSHSLARESSRAPVVQQTVSAS